MHFVPAAFLMDGQRKTHLHKYTQKNTHKSTQALTRTHTHTLVPSGPDVFNRRQEHYVRASLHRACRAGMIFFIRQLSNRCPVSSGSFIIGIIKPELRNQSSSFFPFTQGLHYSTRKSITVTACVLSWGGILQSASSPAFLPKLSVSKAIPLTLVGPEEFLLWFSRAAPLPLLFQGLQTLFPHTLICERIFSTWKHVWVKYMFLRETHLHLECELHHLDIEKSSFLYCSFLILY